MNHIYKRLLTGIGLGLLAAAAVIFFTYILFPTVFNKFELQTLDMRFTRKISLLEEQRAGEKIEEIVIVDIDNRSLNKLGRFHQWPRDYYAEITNYLTQGGARAIGFDILFMERDIDRVADTMFVQATKMSGIVTHALSFSRAEPDAFLYRMNFPPEGFDYSRLSYGFEPETMRHFPQADRFDGKFIELYNASKSLGFVNYQPDNDSVIRKMPLFMNFADRLYPTFALALIINMFDVAPYDISIVPGKFVKIKIPAIAPDEALELPIDKNGQMLINYTGTFQTFRYVSFYDVLTKRIPADFFKNKIILIGASAPGLNDLRPVPFQEAFPGVEIHANMLYNILHGDFIYKKSPATNIFILVLLCLFIGIVASFFRMWISIPLLLFVIAGFMVATFFAFWTNNQWIDNVRPFIGIIASQVAVLGFKYFREIKDKKRIKQMFQNYVSPSVVNELLKNPDMLKLGGERKIATAFFSDIKNFTSYSENLQPEQLVQYLNEYLAILTEVILKYQGYLDKYEGDAVVAIFGAPIEQPDHAIRACRAAVDIQKQLKKYQQKWKLQNRPPFETRIGLNSGPMIVGNIGGINRFDYTAIGDSVNLASRLEGTNKIYGTSIIISQSTFQLVGKYFWCRELDLIRVKGKAKPVRIYEIVDEKSTPLTNEQRAAMEYFLKGLEKYRMKNFRAAREYFLKSLQITPDDGPAAEFVRRCNLFEKNPPPPNWDGVFEMTTK